ncbi:MipA/OmpV family protein [Novosphingopyxis sp.]|uniref:MipA/OmpV family protein n=1 Tax=Novosphingopyxis sp. TaxID=2709690 RepID=UPI003B5B7927
MRLPLFAAGLCAAALSVPAFAQDVDTAPLPEVEDTVFAGDFITIGAGVGITPSYSGSDDYTFFPVPAAAGTLGGINFRPSGTGLAFDVIPDAEDAQFGFIAGPVARIRLDRTRRIVDDAVEQLGELDTAIELGGQVGVQYSGIITPFDTLSVTLDAVWDVAGAYNGRMIRPTVSFLTPVSRGTAIALSVNAEHVDDDFADYYYSSSPSGALASGLPVFQAEGGFQSVGANALFTYDLNGDLTDGGFAVFVLAGYSRLLGDAKHSPITSIRGSANQFLGGIGLGYTF